MNAWTSVLADSSSMYLFRVQLYFTERKRQKSKRDILYTDKSSPGDEMPERDVTYSYYSIYDYFFTTELLHTCVKYLHAFFRNIF